jgi:hypothetical protein
LGVHLLFYLNDKGSSFLTYLLWLLAFGFWLLALGFWLLALCFWHFALGSWLLNLNLNLSFELEF